MESQFEWTWRYLMEVARISPDRPIGEVFAEVEDVRKAAQGEVSPEKAAQMGVEQAIGLGGVERAG